MKIKDAVLIFAAVAYMQRAANMTGYAAFCVAEDYTDGLLFVAENAQ